MVVVLARRELAGSLQRSLKRVEASRIKKGATLEPPLSGLLTISLEAELQRKLNQPGVSGCRYASEVGRTNAAVRITKVRMVEDVENLRPEFNDLVLTNPGSLHHCKVEKDVARSMEHVAAETAESTGACIYRIGLPVGIQAAKCGAIVCR